MPCHCAQCSLDPLPTYTEKFKIECLARVIAKLDKPGRNEIYGIYRKKHGDKFTNEVIVEVNNQRRSK